MRLADKVAFISGAGGGMGREAALMFAKEGAKIIANDYRPEAVEETVKLVQQAGGEAIAVPGDVASASDVKRAIELGEKEFGKIDVLYNNAGVMPDEDESVTDMTDEVWERVLNINAKGVAHCCQYGIPALLRAGGGSVVNIASFVSLVGCSIPQDAYTASKGAVLALTHSLAVQFGPKGVRTNAISPGPILTPLLDELLADPAKRALRLNRIPMGRFGKASDIVYAGIYLASDESTWVNGANLVVDGGITVNYF
ncbi:MAG TPA: glucose 1-dehydrogenase [Candidatus Acetothermia bacterium]|nr:glucose 1-dehydrogenase [Candidatus Acetothermia bacterium]HEX32666.1 glucose 1-dehydrogenase [Candidatus Acetothermia bacterium]